MEIVLYYKFPFINVPYVLRQFPLGILPYKIVSLKYVVSGRSLAWSTFVVLVYVCGSAFSIYQTISQINTDD